MWSKWMCEMVVCFALVCERPPCPSTVGTVLPSPDIPSFVIAARKLAREVPEIKPHAEVKDERVIGAEARENDKAK